MPQTSAWYSTQTRDVHHSNTGCNTGNNIEDEYVAQGTGGLPLCSECSDLNDQGK